MNNEQLQTLLDSHGADPARWPQTQRAAAERLIVHNAEARALFDEVRRLDTLLSRLGRASVGDEQATARVMARLTDLPRQKRPFWHWPSVLLDWQFAPAWPRVVALASCALIGFMVGLTGLDRTIESYQSPQTAAVGEDITTLFEPETLTGVRP